MWWIIALVAVLAVLVGGGVWLLVPTMLTFRGPSFEPTSKDDASVLNAQQAGTSAGAGGGGG